MDNNSKSKTDLYIQINFKSGLGDFFAYCYEVYFFSKKMKSIGYNLKLFINTANKIDFKNLFEQQFYDIFDTVEIKSLETTDLDFLNYKVVNKTYNEIGHQSWELFAPLDYSEPFEFTKFNLASEINYDYLSDFPKLNNKITQKLDLFIKENNLEDFVVIHFRERDDIADHYNSELLTNNLQNINLNLNQKIVETIDLISKNNKQVFVCSNNIQIKLFLKKYFSNIITYPDNILQTLKRTYSNSDYYTHCLTEFYLMSKSKQIFLFSEYGWVSNFLIYALLHAQNIPINPHNKQNSFLNFCGSINI